MQNHTHLWYRLFKKHLRLLRTTNLARALSWCEAHREMRKEKLHILATGTQESTTSKGLDVNGWLNNSLTWLELGSYYHRDLLLGI